jgi:hypothetical protein
MNGQMAIHCYTGEKPMFRRSLFMVATMWVSTGVSAIGCVDAGDPAVPAAETTSSAVASTWAGCRGNGANVCTDAANAQYFADHPNCTRNTACAGKLYTCWAECPPPTPTEMTNAVTWGKSFAPGETLVSPNLKYKLIWQASDGNLVVYDTTTNRAVWDAATEGSGADELVYQTDGNFVMYKTVATTAYVYVGTGGSYNASGRSCTPGTNYCWYAKTTKWVKQAVWNTRTDGSPAGSYLVMQTDGNLVMYAPSGAVEWSSL